MCTTTQALVLLRYCSWKQIHLRVSCHHLPYTISFEVTLPILFAPVGAYTSTDNPQWEVQMWSDLWPCPPKCSVWWPWQEHIFVANYSLCFRRIRILNWSRRGMWRWTDRHCTVSLCRGRTTGWNKYPFLQEQKIFICPKFIIQKK